MNRVRNHLRGAVALLVLLVAGTASAQTINDIDVVSPEPVDTRPLADLTARLAYNSDLGAVVGAGVRTDRLFGDQTLRLGFEFSEDTQRYNLFYGAPNLFGSNPVFGMRVFAAQSNGGDVYSFDSRVLGIEPRLTWRLNDQARLSAYLGFSWGEISDVSATTSQIIRNDLGERQRQLVGLEYRYQIGGNGGAFQRLSYGITAEIGRSDTNHEYNRLAARIGAGWLLGQNDSVLVRAQLRAGSINSTQGTSHIGDRTFLGQSSLRGFAFGGFGPRDLNTADRPALGGNRYAVARLDAQFPNLVRADRIVPGVFFDAGSLWGLDDTGGGVAGANRVDDSFSLRSSVGVSVEIQTGVGPISLSVAAPIESEIYDRRQEFSISFQRSF